MKKVLLITYYFPPAGGPGVQRIMSWVRHFPSCGWEPVVLTVEGGSYPNRDEASVAQIPPDLKVFRAPTWEPFALYNRLRGRPADDTVPVGYVAKEEASGFLAYCAKFIRANVFIPDARVGWVRPAVRVAKEVISTEKPDVILTSGPPHSVHLIGRKLARNTGIPWVADFRDPWTQIYYNEQLPRTGLARRIDFRLEQSCVQEATRVVTIDRVFRDTFGPHAAEADLVSNGFEENDFRGDIPPVSDRFEMVFTGNLSELHPTGPFIQALHEAVQQNSALAADCSLVFVGNVAPRTRAELQKAGLEQYVKYTGFLPHADAVKAIRRATIPLFIGQEGVASAKIFEYLATGRPVLALAPVGGQVDQLLTNAGLDRCVDPADVHGIRNRILQLHRTWKNDKLAARPPMAGVEQFTRRNLAGRMAEVLEKTQK